MAQSKSLLSAKELPTVIVHWLERSRSQRVVWLLEECSVDYVVKTYKRVNGLAPPELKQIHPLGKAPIVTVKYADCDQLVIAESGTIFEYFTDHFAPQLAPERYAQGQEKHSETESWQRYRYYMHYSEGSLMSLLMRKHDIHPLKGSDVDKVSARLDQDLKIHLSFLESQIKSSPGDGQYFCGKNFSSADIMISFPLMVIQASMGGLEQYPALALYLGRLKERPSYKTAVEKSEQASGERYILA